MSKSQLSKQARAYFARKGREGGKTKGPSKARTTEQARAAARARWAKKGGA